jgi:hypothetical protein
LKKYIEDGEEPFQFRIDLRNINQLLTPIDQGLQTLEGRNVTCSDVFTIFIGIAIGYFTMRVSHSTAYPPDLF